MSVIKAFDLAYGRLRSPDLDRQEEFLTDFGMVRADRTKTALYMRGTDAPHHLHVTELGEPRYVGIAVHAAAMEDLERIARAPAPPRSRTSTSPAAASGCASSTPTAIRSRWFTACRCSTRSRCIGRGSIPATTNTAARANCSGSIRALAHQAARPFRGDEQEFREDARLVSRDAGLPLLGRILCRRPEQHGRLVQPARPRRRLCRPSRVLLHSRRQERAQPSLLRGGRHRRRDDRPRASRKARAISTCGALAAI